MWISHYWIDYSGISTSFGSSEEFDFGFMGSDICMNERCAAVTAIYDWKKGWPLRSGGFAQLCSSCGSEYENSVFCNKFHHEDTGWRECKFCNKSIHCGCISSVSLFVCLDFGGICCVSCEKASQLRLMQNNENLNGPVTSTKNNASDQHFAQIDGRIFMDSVDEGKLMQLCRIVEASESNLWPQAQRDGTISSHGQTSQEVNCPIKEADAGFPNVLKPSVQSLTFSKLENNRPPWKIKDMHDSPAQPSLSMSLATPSGNSMLPSSREIVELRDEGKASPPFNQGQRSRPILPKPLKGGLTMNIETNKGMISQSRIARPPAEGRGKNQLLPRYWPRITDQELQQLSGDLKSTVVPLFEKVLSASDAGRIGRLVLPKACAEAYFPSISQSEGLPLRIQDVKGNEWTFQFRFWPNNNSRMYVLEGVTPCIQSMELRAGDTVTFSRIDPGGKMMMGFRKAASSVDTQDASTSALPNGISSKETAFSGATENLPSGSSYSDLLHSMKGSKEPHLNGPSAPPRLEKKRTRNIGPKSKRLLIHSDDALELRLTWEEAQDLLRPPPSVEPSIVTIEDHVFEEYDEPPVFGKRTIFSAHPSGGQEQWAQCDNCSKWRRLPADVLLPPKWTCSENAWDDSRSSCSGPEELSPKELENLLRTSKDFKKRRIAESSKSPQEHEPSGLDALASAAILGDSLVEPGESSAGATTRHPRHRPGCSCIVCIQPPSGKGRHKPTCTCQVCMTVKRRFKTLMLRKKKRQSEREADAVAQKDHNDLRDETETNSIPRDYSNNLEPEENLDRSQPEPELWERSTGEIDLNCDPSREDISLAGPSMSNHVEMANYPLQDFMNQNGLRNLNTEQLAATPRSCLLTQRSGEAQRYLADEGCFASGAWEQEKRDTELYTSHNSSSLS
ncbi:hypothetical protein L6164_029575 [Bauhinia variegata]|uniref:Uncharacterized protein n=1 Tax=Bauhinia variegata TaxID=167791 RepID=A0ACB9LA29_BAUVA|nr:hypothetical protein L6164_029575 [Bauhinia variegata]